MYAEMFADARNEPYDFENPKPAVKGIPSIKIVTDGEKTTLLEFETEEARDVEHDRIEAILHGRTEPVFENLSLNKSIVQSVHAAWGYNSLKVSIKLGTEEPVVIGISEHDEAELERAKTFLAHFGLAMPLTMAEQMDKLDMFDDKGALKDKAK